MVYKTFRENFTSILRRKLCDDALNDIRVRGNSVEYYMLRQEGVA